MGLPGTSVSWKGVKRNDVETVWDQAWWAVWPMRTIGTPSSEPPETLSLPGIVSCAWKNRSEPSHGKCGLPSSMPRLFCVASLPSATALEPIARPLNSLARPSASCSLLGIGGIGALGCGGCAPPMRA